MTKMYENQDGEMCSEAGYGFKEECEVFVCDREALIMMLRYYEHNHSMSLDNAVNKFLEEFKLWQENK